MPARQSAVPESIRVPGPVSVVHDFCKQLAKTFQSLWLKSTTNIDCLLLGDGLITHLSYLPYLYMVAVVVSTTTLVQQLGALCV